MSLFCGLTGLRAFMGIGGVRQVLLAKRDAAEKYSLRLLQVMAVRPRLRFGLVRRERPLIHARSASEGKHYRATMVAHRSRESGTSRPRVPESFARPCANPLA